MTNATKWLIAIPFTALVGLILPALVTGDFLWFLDSWSETLYAALTLSMWLIATAFVDVSKPRGKPDSANRLISLGLILSVPIATADRTYLFGTILPGYIPVIASVLCFAAILLGMWARISLGQAYSPRGESRANDLLVQTGPYRVVRHPMYAAACMWAFFWPLLINSLIGALLTSILVVYAVSKRIEPEEQSLIAAFGDAYREYRKITWRLIPYIY